MGPDPAYVEPGDRVIRVQKEAYPTFEQHQIFEAGRTAQIKVALRAGEGSPAPTVSVSRVDAVASVPATAPAQSDPGSPASGLTPANDAGGTSERTIVLVSGAGLTTVALTLGVVFTLKGSSANRDATDQKASLVAMGGGTNACGGPSASSADCAHLADTLDARNSANSAAKISFAAAGVLGAATLVTYFLWPRRSGTELSLAPQIAPGALGLWASGTY
jgi:hypothetical protein